MWTSNALAQVTDNLERWLALAEQDRFDEIAAEREDLVTTLIAAAHEPSINQLALRVGLKIDAVMRWRGHWDAWYAVLLNLLLASQILDDRVSQARLWERVGALYNLQGEQNRATAAHQTARTIAHRLGEASESVGAWALAGLIDDARRRDALDEALSYIPLALSEAHRTGDIGALANVYMVSANVYGTVYDMARALEYAQMAYVYWRRLGDRVGAAKALHILGIIYQMLGRPERAMQLAQSVAAVYESVNSAYLLGLLNSLMGDLYDEIGDWSHAAACYYRAERYLQDQNAAFDLAIVWQNLGAALARRERWEEAEYYLLRALRAWRGLNVKRYSVAVLYELGDLCARQERKGEAIIHLTEALELAERFPHEQVNDIVSAARAWLANLRAQ
ncbi:MAG: tetratricopeptide repeat protein [Anaerolineae bacterium]|nr:tetratricopeptide repeat protein [Anaerolineae bacterium]